MHPVGALWATNHSGVAEDHPEQCQACHGTDYRGTVLSRAFGPRTLSTKFGTKILFRGATVSCYMCHNGPSGSGTSTNRAPIASNLSATTAAGVGVVISLSATDADNNPLTYRIVSQPANGTVSLAGSEATYKSSSGFTGTETFTYAAWDGSVDSNLATVTVTVTGQPCTISASASAPSSATVGTGVQFTASATASNCSSGVTYDWNFGDGTAHTSTQNPSHTYNSASTFTWTMTAAAGGVTAVKSGSIAVSTAPSSAALTITRVRARSNPFSLEIDGIGFQVGVSVFIGTDTAAWEPMTRSSSTQLLLTGSGLSAKFPLGTAVTIKVVNPDGKSATTTFTRRR
jgi:PKD repeat protein